MPDLLDLGRRELTRLTHRIYSLPVVVLMPHSRCNCRCVMCDIWKANREKREIDVETLDRHLDALGRLHVRWVVLSGGEALMHANLWALCERLKGLPARITLLSTGLLLEAHANDVVTWCDDVIVSVDGSRPTHDAIRRVPGGFDRLVGGVAALRALAPGFRVTGRAVLQRRNFRDLPHVITAAREMGLDQISFLAADVSSSAFNRPTPWDATRVADVALDRDEVRAFGAVVEDTLVRHAADFASGFIAESPDRIRSLVRYFGAVNGDDEFPPVSCNAPWVSTVIEADGTVRPCFFHRALGNIHERALDDILNDPGAVAFRRGLDVATDAICRRCVCTLQLGPGASIRASPPGSSGLARP